MLEEFQLCKEFGWTPAELADVPDQKVQDFKEVIRWRHFYEEREQKRAARQS